MSTEITAAQNKAIAQEAFYIGNGVHYGNEPSHNGDASWALSLNHHRITPDQMRLLQTDIPQAIADYHSTSAVILGMSFDPAVRRENPAINALYKRLTTRVPENVIGVFEDFAKLGVTAPFSTRPDIVTEFGSSRFKIIEYNCDGGADKGNTEAVNQATAMALGEQVVGQGLADLFIQQIRKNYSGELTVATVLPDNYRQEYNAQNRFFARVAHSVGSKYGISWISAMASEIFPIKDAIYSHTDGHLRKIDLIDREFKLPGYLSEYDFQTELAIVKAVLKGRVGLLGSVLPFGDKTLLATIFDSDFEEMYRLTLEALGDCHASSRLARLRTLHAQTSFVDPDITPKFYGESLTWDIILNLQADRGFVLKRGGDTHTTTGSKGVVISTDVDLFDWQTAIGAALQQSVDGTDSWIIQELVEPEKRPVHHILNSRSLPKTTISASRFSPYYVRTNSGYDLGRVLVTAGTDRETVKKGWRNIHAQKKNTYQGVSVDD